MVRGGKSRIARKDSESSRVICFRLLRLGERAVWRIFSLIKATTQLSGLEGSEEKNLLQQQLFRGKKELLPPYSCAYEIT